jgi:transcriptional regulator with XRE-family HTH domain
MRTIGDTIKLLREERRLSQQALADGLNIKRSTISMWESGKRAPNDELKEQICDFFNVDLNFLYGITDCRNSAREHPDGLENETHILTDHERKHLEIYRSLDDKGQHTVDTVTQMEYERVKKDNK